VRAGSIVQEARVIPPNDDRAAAERVESLRIAKHGRRSDARGAIPCAGGESRNGNFMRIASLRYAERKVATTNRHRGVNPRRAA
jgi:hypothetical protein